MDKHQQGNICQLFDPNEFQTRQYDEAYVYILCACMEMN